MTVPDGLPGEEQLRTLSRRERLLCRCVLDVIVETGHFRPGLAGMVARFRAAVPDATEPEMRQAVRHAIAAMESVRSMPSRARH